MYHYPDFSNILNNILFVLCFIGYVHCCVALRRAEMKKNKISETYLISMIAIFKNHLGMEKKKSVTFGSDERLDVQFAKLSMQRPVDYKLVDVKVRRHHG